MKTMRNVSWRQYIGLRSQSRIWIWTKNCVSKSGKSFRSSLDSLMLTRNEVPGRYRYRYQYILILEFYWYLGLYLFSVGVLKPVTSLWQLVRDETWSVENGCSTTHLRWQKRFYTWNHRWARHQIILSPISDIWHRYSLVRYRTKVCRIEGL
jgi:hypothetical protein